MSDPRDNKHFDTSPPVAKQVGGPPPPPAYTANVGAPPPQNPAAPQYQYPNSQQPQSQPIRQYQQQPPQQQQFQQPQQQYVVGQPQQHYVGAVPVVHGVSAPTPVMVSAAPMTLYNPAPGTGIAHNKLEGYPYSPNIGQPLPDIFDCGNQSCMMSCCCPCIVGGQVAQKLGMGTYGMVCCVYITVCISALILVTLLNNGLPWLLLWLGWSSFVMMLRMKIRKMWSVPGSECDDCGVSFCCTACTLSQVCHGVGCVVGLLLG